MTDENVMRWKKGSHDLYAFGRVLPVICDVRNEVNGRRLNHEVVRSIPDGKPYQPRTFPVGTWPVLRPRAAIDKDIQPIFIPVDAYLELPVWELDENDHYLRATIEKIIDRGYGLHISVWVTSLGCIVLRNLDDLLWLVDKINEILDKDEELFLEVYR